jgi:hypothetical protein
MEAMFAPPPYGIVPPPSAFAEAMMPHNAGVWEHFRSVDADKEQRVLQVREPGVVLGAGGAGAWVLEGNGVDGCLDGSCRARHLAALHPGVSPPLQLLPWRRGTHPPARAR